jgi:NAD(P)-dependent dehydrogenase (short-subunit alcohol dehydrogenase family)
VRQSDRCLPNARFLHYYVWQDNQVEQQRPQVATWQRTIDVNLTGMFVVCRAAQPHLQQVGGGAIVYIASASAPLPSGASAAYCASEAGVLVVIAAEVAPSIRANAICPGGADTPMIAGARETDPGLFGRLKASYALGGFAA